MRQRARPFIANLFLSIGEMLYLSSITFSHLLTWSLVHERGSPGRWLCDELVWSADASIKSKVIPFLLQFCQLCACSSCKKWS
jgi:hypothetical protein